MSDEKRTASEILLSLERKVDTLLKIYSSHDLNIKLISNKLNNIISNLESGAPINKPKFKIEVADEANNNKSVFVENNTIPVSQGQESFRRTSRVESFISQPVEPEEFKEIPPTNDARFKGSIPVNQRLVDRNKKSIFLAKVEIFTQNNELIHTTKTSSVGKWQASLQPGDYKVRITKDESISNPKIDIEKNISIDADKIPNILNDLVI